MSEELGVNVTTEYRFLAYEGEIFANAVGGNGFWRRYLDTFSWVRVIARVQQVDSLPDAAIPMTDSRITFACLPGFQGPSGVIGNLSALWLQTKKFAEDDSAFILRVPGLIGSFLYWHLRLRNWPYAVEVVGDPQDSLSQQAIGKSWATAVRPIAVQGLRQQCRHAAAATYVTKNTLQQRYPTQAEFVTYFSDVELFENSNHQEKFIFKPAKLENNKQEEKIPILLFVGSLSQRYKGLHVLLEAIKICLSQEVALNLIVLGDGANRYYYEKMVSQLGLDEVVTFRGYVKQGEEVFNVMFQADLFVMPSLVEGLPRAMIEAMSCGLPCIGSKVGGIPELLESENMVTPGDAPALAEAIMSMLNNPTRMATIGQRNREVAMMYHPNVLRSKRQQFYNYLRDITLEQKQLQAH